MKPYLTVKINRLFHGYCSVRSHVWERVKQSGQGLEFIVDNKHMTVEWKDLDKGFHNEEVFTSKHDGRKYHLVDFDFREMPKEPEPIQYDIFSTIQQVNSYTQQKAG